MNKTKFEDVRMSPVMRFEFYGSFTDVYGEVIASPVHCTLPMGHDGPCANVEYAKIEYGEESE